MLKRILIANRGEIAIRIIRTCKELGIETVAVYSEGDSNSLHTKFADESVCIGPTPSEHSYLSIPRIISACEVTGADAVHPGYGFLAENARFAEICEENGFEFIGPTPRAMKLAGNKVNARTEMKKAGIPVIPGSDTPLDSAENAVQIAEKIGYPIIIKASLGGGGRGMRIANNAEALKKAFPIAKAEARSAFQDDQVYIEKYFESPRHIEVQILADAHNNVIWLGERECSIQRRHQKLIEEAPSPGITEEQRKEIGDYAVAAATAIRYRSAGTVEFLLDRNNHFYFLEMNSRIQVEHPVTEMVTGIDIVKEQLRIASGEDLGIKQNDIKITGHAIECRINAENHKSDFMPSPGKIDGLYVPGGPGIRVDTHLYGGYRVLPNYDSLIAKLIAHGKTRSECIARMQRALSEFLIDGIHTTIPFHEEIIRDERFKRGEIHTHFLETKNHSK
jgi:acetyl-CoA carboxylase biotin carboxylase subunit